MSLEELDQALDQIVDNIDKISKDFMVAFNEAIKPVVDHIYAVLETYVKVLVIVYENITRYLLLIRLVKLGFPINLAKIMSRYWPVRVLPYKWAWSSLSPPA